MWKLPVKRFYGQRELFKQKPTHERKHKKNKNVNRPKKATQTNKKIQIKQKKNQQQQKTKMNKKIKNSKSKFVMNILYCNVIKKRKKENRPYCLAAAQNIKMG